MFSHLVDPPMVTPTFFPVPVHEPVSVPVPVPVHESEPGTTRLTPLSLAHLAAGRLLELSGGVDAAQGSGAVALLCALQRRGEHVAWVAPRDAGLFPPDWQRAGLDLDALLVVHVPPRDPRAGPRAAELLLRTGVMGAVVLDLSSAAARVADRGVRDKGVGDGARDVLRGEAWMGKLLGLAREHGTRLVLLSPFDHAQPSLGPLVSVRLAIRHAKNEEGLLRDTEGRLTLALAVLKDKSGLTAGLVDDIGEEHVDAHEAANDPADDAWRRTG